jgi:uncharacterized protein (DUF488 family)
MRLYTVGYGGRKPDEFIALLKKHDVEIIVDVRLKPERAFMGVYAKSKDPHKGIQGLLEKASIQYIWIAELGNMFRDIDDWHEKYRRYLDEKGDLVCLKLYELMSRGASNTTSMDAFKTSQLIFLFHTLVCHNPQV